MVEYQWSSYKNYAYGKLSPEWLMTDVLLSQIFGQDKNRGYKETVQSYSKEEKGIWEDFRHGLLFGSKEYCDYIKSKYISKKKPDVESPQKRLILREENLQTTIRTAASVLECDISSLINPKRLKDPDKDKRDILILLLWNTGLYWNYEMCQNI